MTGPGAAKKGLARVRFVALGERFIANSDADAGRERKQPGEAGEAGETVTSASPACFTV
jgi:hypothetical protein